MPDRKLWKQSTVLGKQPHYASEVSLAFLRQNRPQWTDTSCWRALLLSSASIFVRIRLCGHRLLDTKKSGWGLLDYTLNVIQYCVHIRFLPGIDWCVLYTPIVLLVSFLINIENVERVVWLVCFEEKVVDCLSNWFLPPKVSNVWMVAEGLMLHLK